MLIRSLPTFAALISLVACRNDNEDPLKTVEENPLPPELHLEQKRQLQTGCPLLNNTQYYSTSNSTTTTFQIFCGFDYPNNDLNMIYTPTLVGCMDTCVAWNQHQQLRCIAVGFRRDSPGQGGYQCWIKGIAAGFTPVAGVDCASVVTLTTAGATSTATSTTVSATITHFYVLRANVRMLRGRPLHPIPSSLLRAPRRLRVSPRHQV